MAGSTRTETADAAVISRREAIVGALALAAGSLIATKPDVARASNGQTLTAGGMAYTSSETILHLTPTASDASNIVSSAVFNRFGFTSFGVVQAVSGVVQSGAGAGSIGVSGAAWASGLIGMQAQHYQAAGTALKVIGRVSLSRSGKATITKGHSGCTVTVASGVDANSLIVATLQGSAGTGVYLLYAKRASATTFTIKLNKTATATVSVAWFLIG
jgi:hypothetical protein